MDAAIAAFRKTQPTFEEAFAAADAHDIDKLHEDLQPYVVTSKLGMPVLRHPFVVELIPAWRMVNWHYRLKRMMYDQVVAERRWNDLMFGILTRPFRLSWLREMYAEKTITRAELRKLLPHVWSDAEPDDTNPKWRTLWLRAAKGGPLLPDAPLPDGDTLTIYRGQHRATDKLGIAWTLDRGTAEFFARRFNEGSGGVVLRTEVPRASVLGYITDRGEQEIVIDQRKLTDVVVDGIVSTDRQSEAVNALVHDLNDIREPGDESYVCVI